MKLIKRSLDRKDYGYALSSILTDLINTQRKNVTISQLENLLDTLFLSFLSVRPADIYKKDVDDKKRFIDALSSIDEFEYIPGADSSTAFSTPDFIYVMPGMMAESFTNNKQIRDVVFYVHVTDKDKLYSLYKSFARVGLKLDSYQYFDVKNDIGWVQKFSVSPFDQEPRIEKIEDSLYVNLEYLDFRPALRIVAQKITSKSK
ncbi:hypothetical protein [Photobacterium leiognathi]|uniref:hypothetical protein n=1 Tax=Photobacterium leiognathi TaxID=553611 RepID=UPI002981952D|nr:hypothetical protein [Photobacterium leiognathi]